MSRGGMDLREGNGAHRHSRAAIALTPTEAGPALRSWAACGTSEAPVLPACSGGGGGGGCETPATFPY